LNPRFSCTLLGSDSLESISIHQCDDVLCCGVGIWHWLD
jgi:hypothetical protein